MASLFIIWMVPDRENQIKDLCGYRGEFHRLVVAWVLSTPHFLPSKQWINGIGLFFDNLANRQNGYPARIPVVGWSQMIQKYHPG
jgi:hypothetical protein